MREELLVGLDYLDGVTTLLQRVRRAHPTHGSYQAAELQWWWSVPRSTDGLGQLFWFDDVGRPEAAFIVTDFGDGSSALYEDPTLVVVIMPDVDPGWVAHAVERGFAHLGEHGIGAVELEVDRSDDVMVDVLSGHGFALRGDGMIESWMNADSRPGISALPDGYRLVSRSDTIDRPHHMAHPRRPDVEQRLQQTSLYRSDLDLLILDESDEVAAYGLFWHDPVTATGVVEPMRTLDDHQRRGLARHLLTAGVDLLAEVGAERISIAYHPDNPASGHLYRSVGFQPHRQTDVYFRGVGAPPA
ncbi:MAG: GNAT family N-acetyltransferase [Acidimicrobiia bacterium]